MKNDRQNQLLQIISEEIIETQEQLLERLQAKGIKSTQATISRDIKELRLVKVQSSDGRYIYAKPTQDRQTGDMEGFRSIFTQSLLHIDYANNIVVIKCRTGMANAVCVSMDQLHWKGVVGTLSGDDTIFVLMRNEDQAAEFVDQLHKISRK